VIDMKGQTVHPLWNAPIGTRSQIAWSPDSAAVLLAPTFLPLPVGDAAALSGGAAAVIDVRSGYKVTGGWISRVPAVVITVQRKLARPPAELPQQIEGVPVDVAPATPTEQLRALPLQERRKYDLPEGDDEEIIRVDRYQPPPGLRLDEVTDAMEVVCHTSPDAGWPTLRNFIAGTARALTVAMYDFTAPHIADFMAATMANVRGPLRLVLDPKIALGSPGEGDNPKANDRSEDEVRDQLAAALRERFQFVWAAVKQSGKTSGAIFPTAYHIKVAVRDGEAFWLSSGNWQSSNQPDVDLVGRDAGEAAAVLRTYNREWHCIVKHRGLARLYGEFIDWDASQAEPFQAGPETAVLPDLLVPEEELEEEIAPEVFKPRTFQFEANRPLRVQPLLSPDNYADRLLELVRSARRTLYVQNQYLKVSQQNPPALQELVETLQKKIDAGVDVRIILRNLPDTRKQLEMLQRDFDFDLSKIRLLANTHTKGVLVDSEVALLGSHNWSGDGIVYNRDASLIFHDAGITGFFEQVFAFDWQRARSTLGFESAMPVLARGEELAPGGMRRVSWSELHPR